MEGQAQTVIANADGLRSIPSAVAFTKDGGWLTRARARQAATTDPENTFSNVKALNGPPL